MNNIPTIARILIVGHSFISRLAQDIQRDPIIDVDFNLKQCEIRCFGVSGTSLEILEKHNGLIEFMNQYKPNIVILQIGGNDICRPDLWPETLSSHIVDFMNSLLVQQQTVCQVFVCELFVRNQPIYITPEQYEGKRQIVNNMLKVFLSDSCKMHFWKHLRLMNWEYLGRMEYIWQCKGQEHFIGVCV